MPTVSGVRRSLQKVKKCHFSMHVNSDVLQMMDSIPFFSARLVCAGHCHQSSLSSPCPDSYAWNKKVNTVRHIQRCSQNLSSLFNNTGVFEGHDANISLQSDILKTLPTKPTPGRHSANKKCNLHFGLVPPEQ